MFAKSVIAFAAAAALVNAAPVEKRGAPAGWAYGYLEDYDTYHVRYLALKCYDQKNTQFFQDCCRPMLSTETLAANRASYCVPSQDATDFVVSSLSAKAAGKTVSSSVAAPSASTTSSASTDDSDDYYCDEESSSASSTTTSAPTQSPVAAAAAPSSSATTSSAAVVGENRVAQQPSTTTTTTQAPTTTTPAWTPAPTTQAPTTQAPQTTQPSSGGGGSHSGGYATYFYQGGNAGACGVVHSDYDMIVAIDHEQWGDQGYGSGSNTCNRWLTVTNTQNGKSVVAMVADVCPTCANGNSLDLSVGAFQAIADLSQGQVPISWSWN